MSAGGERTVTRVDVVVIGAGIAGLFAADELQRRHGCKVAVVEATRDAGGRILMYQDYADLEPLHLGAEIIHGPSNAIHEIAREEGWDVSETFIWAHGDGGPSPAPVGGKCGYYFLGRRGAFVRHDTDDAAFGHLCDVLGDLCEVDVPPSDTRTLREYLVDEGVTDEMVALADAGYANTLCSSIDLLPLRETAALERGWVAEDGEEERDFFLKGTYKRLVDLFANRTRVFYDWVVQRVEYDPRAPLCRVVSRTGDVVLARRVISTVPATVLADGDIAWSPALPTARLRLLKGINMEPAVKVITTWRARFWPEDMAGCICAERPIPEFWFKRRDAITPSTRQVVGLDGCAPKDLYVSVCFFTSGNARRVAAMRGDEVRAMLFAQVNEMFGTPEEPEPAQRHYLGHMVYDWAKSPFVRGGYSSPSANCPAEARASLAEPLADRLYFAGEAFEPNAYMSVHAAMNTARTAANQVAASLATEGPTSRL